MSDKFYNFLEKANKIHNGFYSYNKSKYISYKEINNIDDILSSYFKT